MSALLTIEGVSMRFGAYQALDRIDLAIQQGEFVALLGPSGCGKTTLLKSIAGFLKPEVGRILIDGQDVSRLPAHRRPLNTVFQNYALFPHMTVLENVAYGPRRQGASKAQAADRARGALDMVGLADFGPRYPREMSGGQQQRVALARAIVNQPKLLLLDEPLSALDLKLRKRMQLELKHLQARLGIAFIFVTHDQEEAMTMADRVVVMHAGRIEAAQEQRRAGTQAHVCQRLIGVPGAPGFGDQQGLQRAVNDQRGVARHVACVGQVVMDAVRVESQGREAEQPRFVDRRAAFALPAWCLCGGWGGRAAAFGAQEHHAIDFGERHLAVLRPLVLPAHEDHGAATAGLELHVGDARMALHHLAKLHRRMPLVVGAGPHHLRQRDRRHQAVRGRVAFILQG